jgi:hypothetical protein
MMETSGRDDTIKTLKVEETPPTNAWIKDAEVIIGKKGSRTVNTSPPAFENKDGTTLSSDG